MQIFVIYYCFDSFHYISWKDKGQLSLLIPTKILSKNRNTTAPMAVTLRPSLLNWRDATQLHLQTYFWETNKGKWGCNLIHSCKDQWRSVTSKGPKTSGSLRLKQVSGSIDHANLAGSCENTWSMEYHALQKHFSSNARTVTCYSRICPYIWGLQ